MLRSLHAKWVLAWALVKHILLAWLPQAHRRRHPELWLGRLAQESLAATPPEAWSYLAQTSRCLGCGLCDVLGQGGEMPSRWLTGGIRQPSDAPVALRHADRLRVLAPQIARICPAGVRAEYVAQLIEDEARALQRA